MAGSPVPSDQLTFQQQTILAVVHSYPGRFSRTGLAQMLVAARSWQDTDYAEYGRLREHRRKDVLFQIDVLLQQGYLALTGPHSMVVLSAQGERLAAVAK